MNSCNQIFIMAAGRGSRMMPLTENTPKPLVKVNGKTMLDRILEKVDQVRDIEKIVINGFYLKDQIENHIISLNNPKIIFSRESEKLETGGGLLKALDFFDRNRPILVINGDIIWQNNDVLTDIINKFDNTESDILLGLKEKDEFLGYEGRGDFDIDQNNNLTSQSENRFVYIGIGIFHPRIFDSTLPELPFSLNYFFKDCTSKNIRLKGTILNGKFFHIGTKLDLEKYQNFVDKK